LEAKNDTEVEPNHIYVIPENASLTVSAGRLQISPRKEADNPNMPIDLFFRSLAQQQQNRAIGVLLSGTGTDGALGIEAIKGEGGITFAQDEASSKFFGMPSSAIASGAVDFILPPQQIAKELARIAQHPYIGPSAESAMKSGEAPDIEKDLRENPPELNTLFGLLRARTGVDFSFYKHSTLNRRIMRRMILQK